MANGTNSTKVEPSHPSMDIPPTVHDYYAGLNTFVILSIIMGSLLFVANIVVFLYSLKRVLKGTDPKFLTKTIFLISLYPIVASCSLLTIFVPRSMLICDSVCHIAFTFCAFQFFNLCFDYVGGEENFLKQSELETFTIRTPPCCCCCFCFHPQSVTPQKISVFRFMILQLPFVQSLLMIALNVVYVEEMEIYNYVLLYFIPFFAVSIMIGVWSLNIVARMILPYAPDSLIMMKFFCLQFVLIFTKLQFAILHFSLKYATFPVYYPMTQDVYIQVIVQLIVLVEILVLNIVAFKAYQRPTWK